jgi:hypothetical protein
LIHGQGVIRAGQCGSSYWLKNSDSCHQLPTQSGESQVTNTNTISTAFQIVLKGFCYGPHGDVVQREVKFDQVALKEEGKKKGELDDRVNRAAVVLVYWKMGTTVIE